MTPSPPRTPTRARARRPQRRRALALAVAVLVATVVTACAEAPVATSPGPRLDLLGPRPSFTARLRLGELPPDWAVAGRLDPARIAVVERAGVPSLRLVGGVAGDLAVVRRTNVALGVMPFLSWSWLVELSTAMSRHPVRLVVGFAGGNSTGRRRGLFAGSIGDLPDHDRVLVLTWESSALARGSLFPAAEPRLPARYAVRGGAENAGTWWLETVDTADLYRRAWPGDDVNATTIVFVGAVAAAAPEAAAMHLSGLRLSR